MKFAYLSLLLAPLASAVYIESVMNGAGKGQYLQWTATGTVIRKMTKDDPASDLKMMIISSFEGIKATGCANDLRVISSATQATAKTVEECGQAAAKRGFNHFSVSSEKRCYVGSSIQNAYLMPVNTTSAKECSGKKHAVLTVPSKEVLTSLNLVPNSMVRFPFNPLKF